MARKLRDGDIFFSLDSQRIQLEEIHRFANGPVLTPDGIHWDVLRLWSEIKAGIGMAVRKHGGQSQARTGIIPFSGIGLDTWGVDFALLDKNGVLLGNPFITATAAMTACSNKPSCASRAS